MSEGQGAQSLPQRWTTDAYLERVERGMLGPDDRVELIEGVIVAMSPHNPEHAAACNRAFQYLLRAVGDRAVVRGQTSLVLDTSVPEPDVAVVPGTPADYDHAHPTRALLVVEVADSSLVQDRLTKAGVYAAAGIPEYWIVNLREDHVEIFRDPDPSTRTYVRKEVASRGSSIELAALAGVRVRVDDLLPS